MGNYLYNNNAQSALLSSIGPTDVSINLTGGQGARFPNPSGGQSFMLTIEDTSGNLEIVQCTARAVDTLTVVRGREGTIAQDFNAGTGVFMRITAGMLGQIDWTKFAGADDGVATLDNTGQIPIAQYQTSLTTFGDVRYNAKLGFTPVQQGGGTGQAANKVYVGFDGTSKVKVQVDVTDFGNIALESWVTGAASAFSATKLSTPRQIALTGGASGSANFDGSGNIAIATSVTIASVSGLSAALTPLAVQNGTNNGNVIWTGSITGNGGVFDPSDIRIKEDLVPMSLEDAVHIISNTIAFRYRNKLTDRDDFGMIANLQEAITPELVKVGDGPEKYLQMTYGRLTAPITVVLRHLIKKGLV